MFKQQNYLAIGAVVIVVVLLLSLPTRVTDRLKHAVGSWFLPLFGLSGAAQQLPADLADSTLPRRELLQDINRLRQQNLQLRAQTIQAAAVVRENDQLRALFHWQRQTRWKLKLANVVMRDPANWWHTIQIGAGTRDGVRVGLPVLTSAGLVGRVSSVSLTRSEVVLIGNPDCRVSAIVEDSTHDMGVVVSGGPVDTTLVNLTYLASGANLKPGQAVVTSGLGSVYPRGIPIGRIVDARPAEYGLYTEARVRLNANLGSLEQVWVLFP